ncbi:MAG: hypothetical protein R2824_02890 [Saprospiraceae bacterium]|nr:hypothetical protein [Lewinella sp.]
MRRLLFRLMMIVSLMVLPFVVLIRTAVYLLEKHHFLPWLALLGGVLASALLIFIYLVYVQSWLRGALGNLRSMRRTYWLALAMVVVYCLPALFYLSNANAKHPQVVEEFTSLHPILRLSISTLVFLDKSLILTDASRLPEDYSRMGLPDKRHSLHYTQSTGYAHAVDMRTRGHSELRNGLIALYFRLMGFNTLRHVGTADHLHVSISSPDRKGAI